MVIVKSGSKVRLMRGNVHDAMKAYVKNHVSHGYWYIAHNLILSDGTVVGFWKFSLKVLLRRY